MMEKVAAYPGTFDPFTNGHLEIIERASKLFDKVVVLVAKREEKNTLFTFNERFEIVKDCVLHIPNVSVEKLDVLLVKYLREHKIRFIVRGARNVSDFEYEIQMFEMNLKMYSEIETVLLFPKENNRALSSTLVKEIINNGGDVSMFIPEKALLKLREKLERKE
ncbi:MAG: pantetheine-phosphate adenylyltransferase [Candidatus Atribacteria bacterium]|nr:pantetheine-phosphate adenylyltransferase [Candidatus Atribacteria bacterium]